MKDDLAAPQIFCVPPAIDPLSPKNNELPQETVDAILERYGVDPHAADDHADLALRPVEGSARRDRRVPRA